MAQTALAQTHSAATMRAASAANAAGPAPVPASRRLRIVGGLAALNQYRLLEEPFWTVDFPRLSAGRYAADIVPFDRAGLRGQEMLSLVQSGVVPFGTILLSMVSEKAPELGAVDLAGLNPDMQSLRRSVAAFRPYLERQLRERYGVEVLSVFVYPSQVLFCNQPLPGLKALAGRRVRTSSVSQADFVEALGAKPMTAPFAEIVTNLRAGNIDCAITGTMSGYTIGLHRHTTHLHAMAVSWGLSVFAVHGPTWAALPGDLKALLKREMPLLERRSWEDSQRETGEGVACNTGAGTCAVQNSDGTSVRGSMTAVRASADDDRLRAELFSRIVLPRWLQRCGATCASVWNNTLASVTGVPAPTQ